MRGGPQPLGSSDHSLLARLGELRDWLAATEVAAAVEAAAALSATERCADVVRKASTLPKPPLLPPRRLAFVTPSLSSVLVPTRPQALPRLREAVAQDGSSLEPMDAETSAQVAELLTCIERDLGGAA